MRPKIKLHFREEDQELEVCCNVQPGLSDTQPLRILTNIAPRNFSGVLLGHPRAVIWLMVNRSNSWLPSQRILRNLNKN